MIPAGSACHAPCPSRHRGRRESWRRSLALAALFAPAVGALILLARMPPLGVPAMTPDQVWAKECGACHYAFHPSLLPRASWAALMADLRDHFGEDASLPPAAAGRDRRLLAGLCGGGLGHQGRATSIECPPADPLRITAAPFWVRRHRRIDPAIFAAPPVKAKSNCIACHRDADSGRFEPRPSFSPPSQPPEPRHEKTVVRSCRFALVAVAGVAAAGVANPARDAILTAFAAAAKQADPASPASRPNAATPAGLRPTPAASRKRHPAPPVIRPTRRRKARPAPANRSRRWRSRRRRIASPMPPRWRNGSGANAHRPRPRLHAVEKGDVITYLAGK